MADIRVMSDLSLMLACAAKCLIKPRMSELTPLTVVVVVVVVVVDLEVCPRRSTGPGPSPAAAEVAAEEGSRRRSLHAIAFVPGLGWDHTSLPTRRTR